MRTRKHKKMTEGTNKNRCPLCHQSSESLLEIPRLIHDRRYAICQCHSCRISFLYPFPPQVELARIYSGEYWGKETDLGKQGRLGRAVALFNQIRLAMLIRPLVKKLPPRASILEVGCGSGHLAAHLKRSGFEIEVTDISHEILNEVKSMYGISGYCGNLEDIDIRRQYDAIIFNNVLEHLPSPDKAIAAAVKWLDTGGIIFVEVPNIHSFQFKLFKANWYHLAIPQHLFHFSPESLDRLMHQHAMTKIWDSTYSPRTSAAGYAASLSPSLQPDKLRQSWSIPNLLLYLFLQFAALPIVCLESLQGRGGGFALHLSKRV